MALTTQQKAAIVRRCDNNENRQKIADSYGISHQRVRQIHREARDQREANGQHNKAPPKTPRKPPAVNLGEDSPGRVVNVTELPRVPDEWIVEEVENHAEQREKLHSFLLRALVDESTQGELSNLVDSLILKLAKLRSEL